MTKEEKLETIADILEVEVSELEDDKELKDFDSWDSVAVLAIISEVIDNTGKYLHASEIEGLNTIQDLINVLGE